MKKKLKDNQVKGFTLIEVMIAMLIFSVLVFILFSSFQAFLTSSKAIKQEVLESEKQKHALTRICKDLEQLFILQSPRYSKPEFNSEEDPYRFVGNTKTLGQKTFSSIRFTSLSHAWLGTDKRPGVARIAYYVKQNDLDLFDLYRSDTLEPFPNDIESCSDPVLCNDISGFEILYTDINGEENTDWDSESDEFNFSIPSMISLKLMFESNGREQIFETSIMMVTGRAPSE